MSCFTVILGPCCIPNYPVKRLKLRTPQNGMYTLKKNNFKNIPQYEPLNYVPLIIEPKKQRAENEEQKQSTNIVLEDDGIRDDNRTTELEKTSDVNEDDGRQVEESRGICGICLDELEAGTVIYLIRCKDKFHAECLKTFVIEEIKVKSFPMKCPECLNEIHGKDLGNLLEEDLEQQNNYNKFYKKFLIERNPEKFILCPESNCEYALLVDSKNIEKKLDCPECKQSYCLGCKLVWHGEISCQKFQKDKEEKHREAQIKLEKKSEKAFLKYTKKMKLRKCPKCGQFIEKINGCCAMTCTRCRGMFCYTCGKKGDGHLCKHRSNCALF